MRGLITFVFIVILWYALRSICRSVVGQTASGEKKSGHRPMGEEMVQDPECRTYVPKGRAISRRINGEDRLFCSEACARQYAEKNRG